MHSSCGAPEVLSPISPFLSTMAVFRNLAQLAVAYPEILLSLACFFVLIFYNWTRSSRVPTNWPLLGMFPGLILHIHRFYDWAVDQIPYNGCTSLFKGPWFSGMNILATVDPANVNHIFNTNFGNYPKGDEYLQIFDFLGDGIFNADSDSWKSQRKAAHSLMSDAKFRRRVARTSGEKVERGLVPLLSRAAEQGTVLDLQDLFLRFTFDTTSNLVFGFDPGCLSLDLPSVPFAHAIDDCEDVVFFRYAMPMRWWKLLRWLRIGEEKKMALACETINEFMNNLMSQKMAKTMDAKEDQEQNEDVAPDLISSYLKARPELRDSPAGSKFLRDTALNLLLAGRDTTSTALTWFFWMVSQHPEVERKILDELKPISKAHASQEKPIIFKVEELKTALYLHAALHEALRLFPPVPLEHKSPAVADVLPSGHKVEAGMKILINLYSMARVEGIWGKDCREFRPERWIAEGGTLKHEPSYKFLSFNSGPRTCLGKDMAFSQMKVVAATMIHNFRIKAVQGHVVVPKLSIILHMKNGLMVNVENRV